MKSRWPTVALGDVLVESRQPCGVQRDQSYPNFGIYSYGKGLFPKPPIEGIATSASTLYCARAGQFVYSRLFAFEGAYGIVPPEFDGFFVSNEFPLFEGRPDRLLPEYLRRYVSIRQVWEAIANASTGMGHRRQRVQPAQLLKFAIPLPSIEEQRRIVVRIEALFAKIADVRHTSMAMAAQCDAMLSSLFRQLADGAPRRRLGDVAPLVRRPTAIDPSKHYPQVSVRSFGRGAFHSGVLDGSAITWEKPHLVRSGDVLISNIKAWEGAVAVAGENDDGRYGSHRYLTYVPVPGVATSRWICHFLLSPEGLHLVGEASPGSADRNRTTSAKALQEILLPVPPIMDQERLDAAYAKVESLKSLQHQSAAELDALLPSILDRAFRGEL